MSWWYSEELTVARRPPKAPLSEDADTIKSFSDIIIRRRQFIYQKFQLEGPVRAYDSTNGLTDREGGDYLESIQHITVLR
jgi:hypothetical protein